MKVEELQHSEIYQALKKNKKVQQAALRLGKTEDWKVIQLFVAELKQALLEATLTVDDISNIRRFKHIIFGMESVAILPGLVDFVKEVEKKQKTDKKESEAEAKRKKYNPGAFIKGQINKFRK